jgi:hypothetical protein
LHKFLFKERKSKTTESKLNAFQQLAKTIRHPNIAESLQVEMDDHCITTYLLQIRYFLIIKIHKTNPFWKFLWTKINKETPKENHAHVWFQEQSNSKEEKELALANCTIKEVFFLSEWVSRVASKIIITYFSTATSSPQLP